MALMFSAESTIKLKTYLSNYFIKFPCVERSSRLGVLFRSYLSMCRTLQIDSSQCDDTMYRENKTRNRYIRAVQVMGES